MKKIIIATFVISSVFLACKKETKKQPKEVKKTTAAFLVQEAKNSINWTAYKTSEKIAVKGAFTKVNITNNGAGNSIKEAIDGVTFTIPISSVFTKDESRDYKIQKFFFGVMENTSLLSGKLTLKDAHTGIASLTMNNTSQDIPFQYTINEKAFAMSATLNINNWNAQKALTSLNTACKDLHTGKDGVSKTWSEVAIEITTVFK